MGLGRAGISPRLLKNFNLVYLNDMDDVSLSSIVENILRWGFEDYIDKVKF